MIRTKNKKVKTDVASDVVCDSCLKSCRKWIDAKHTFPLDEYATLTVHWGYGSKKRDGQSCENHLCQECWESITSKFKNLKIESRF